MTLPDFRHDVLQCPVCLAALDGSLAVNSEHRPKPGDVSLCISCTSLLKFGDGLRLEPVLGEEWVKVMSQPDIAHARWALMVVLVAGGGQIP